MTDEINHTHTEADLAPHIATIHKHLKILGDMFIDFAKYSKKSYTPIPYYRAALQSQRQFCQGVQTIKSLMPKKSSQTGKAD